MATKYQESLTDELAHYLRWALDLIDTYDRYLVERGDPPERVYSDIHRSGKARGRGVLILYDVANTGASDRHNHGSMGPDDGD